MEKKYARLRLEEQAARALKELTPINSDADSIDNPLEALAALAGEVVRWKDIIAARVSELNSVRYQGGGEEGATEQIRGEVVLFERALDRTERVLVSIAKLNLDERLTRIEERKADLVMAAIEEALKVGGVPEAKRASAEKAAARVLRSAS